MSTTLPFPLLTIGNRLHGQGRPGGPAIDYVSDAADFSTLSVHDVRLGTQVGKILIGRDGRCWEILSVTGRGIGSPWKIWWILGLFFGFLHWVEYELLELEPLTLDQVKDRAIAIISGAPEDWGFDDDGASVEGTLDEFIDRIRDAPDLVQVINVIFDAHLPVGWDR